MTHEFALAFHGRLENELRGAGAHVHHLGAVRIEMEDPGDRVLEQGNQRREVVARIQQDDRMNVKPEALQRQRLE